jgi:hypothetical protein
MKRKKKITQINSLDEMPNFKSEDEERRFWETHGLSEDLMDELHDVELEKKERDLSKRIRMTDRRKSN